MELFHVSEYSTIGCELFHVLEGFNGFLLMSLIGFSHFIFMLLYEGNQKIW